MYSDGKRSGVRMRRRLGLPTAPKLLALIVPYLCRCVSVAKMDSVELVTLTLGLGLGLGQGLGEGPPQARLAADPTARYTASGSCQVDQDRGADMQTHRADS